MIAEYSISADEFKEELVDDSMIEFVYKVRDHASSEHMDGAFAEWIDQDGNLFIFEYEYARMTILVELDSNNEYTADVDIYTD